MRRVWLCGLLAGTFMAQVAVADGTSAKVDGGSARDPGTRYPRTQPPPAPVTLSERVQPPTAAAAPAPDPVKPSIDITALLEREMPSSPMRPEQERILMQLIENTPDSAGDEKADYLFRLASFYSSNVGRLSAQAVQLSAAVTASTDRQTQARQTRELQSVTQQAKLNLLKSVKVYKTLTDNATFHTYAKIDTALFQYGYTLQVGRYMKEARAVYDKLLKTFPSSAHVPFAHLAFAAYYDEADQLADAEARYKQVLKFPKSAAYWYAMYRLGWVKLQLQHYQESLELFAQVVFGTRGDAKRTFVHDAARNDFVYAYAKIGKLERAFDAFSRIDAGAAVDLVVTLADAAHDRGDIEAAIGSYRHLLAKAPKDGRACQWQYRIAHASIRSATVSAEDKVRAIESLVAAHVKEREAAAAEHTTEDPACRDNASAMAGELAAAYYAEWSKTKNTATLGFAERLYTAYVGGFSGGVAQTAALAEVLWSSAEGETNAKRRAERWERAARAFAAIPTTAATDDGATPHSAVRAAALAWLNALDYVAPTTSAWRLAKRPAAAARPLKTKPHDEALIAALSAYLEVPATADPRGVSDERAQVALALATTLRKLRRFDEATDVLDRFLADHASHASAEYAANLLLDSLIQARSPDLDAVVSGMLADVTFVKGKPQLVRTLAKLRPR